MPLTPEERERVKYHLGYLNTATAAAMSFGQSVPIQTLFLVERAMTFLQEVTLPRVRALLNTLDNIECRLQTALDYSPAESLGNLKVRQDEPDFLEKEYVRWGGRLADNLGVPFYAYSLRYKDAGGVMAGNIPTRR